MDRIDAFLTNRARTAFDGAMVFCSEEGSEAETWVLKRNGEDDLGLGINFAEAKRGLEALLGSVKEGESTIFTTSIGGADSNWRRYTITRVARSGRCLEFHGPHGNPLFITVSSDAQAEEIEQNVKSLLAGGHIRLGDVSSMIHDLLQIRYLRLRGGDTHRLKNHPEINWNWGAASAMVSDYDKIVWMPDGKLKSAKQDHRSEEHILLDLDFGYKDGTSGAIIRDEKLRLAVLVLLQTRGVGHLMKEILEWPSPI